MKTNNNHSIYEQYRRRERTLKDIVLFTLLGTPLIVASVTANVVASAVTFGVMFLPALLMYIVITKRFDDVYRQNQGNSAFYHPRDQFGRFVK